MTEPRLEIVDSYQTINRGDIAAVEKSLDVRFPAQYVAFLLKYNGGRFRQCAQYGMRESLSRGPGGISHFYGISDQASPGFGHLRGATTVDGVDGLVPIAEDQSGVVFICCLGSYKGNIYLRPSDRDGEKELFLVANTFNEFLSSCFVREIEIEDITGAFGAIQSGDASTLKNDIERGLKLETRNADGDTLLSFACKCGTMRCTEMLLQYGAAMSVENKHGQSPLEVAVLNWSIDCVRLLIKQGQDVDIRCSNGDTPLLLAVRPGNPSARIAELLIDAGAEINARDASGATALCYASGFTRDFDRVVDLLISRGADVPSATEWLKEHASGDTYWPFNALLQLGAKAELILLAKRGERLAMEQLVELGPTDGDVHAAFRKASLHQNPAVREFAAECIGYTHCATRANLQTLRRLSEDTDVTVRNSAAKALEDIKWQ